MSWKNTNETQNKISWLEVPKAIWYFLGENKAKYVVFTTLLFVLLFYELVPPYILGKIVDFFTDYKRGDPLNEFYFYTSLLGASSIIIALIRLASKNRLDRIAIATKIKARVEAFQRLMDFSLTWHTNENSGSKAQRVFTGSQSIHEWVWMTNNNLFPVATSFIGVLGVFLFLSPVFLVFFIVYACCYFAIEYGFNRRLEHINNEFNKQREKSSGVYIESTGNILAIKALGAEKSLHGQIRAIEEKTKELEINSYNLGIKKWYSFNTLNGIALVVFLLLTARQLTQGIITVGSILVFFAYYTNLKNATTQSIEMSGKAIKLKSDLLRMMPIFREYSQVKTGTENFPQNWKSISIQNGNFKYHSGQMGISGINFSLNKNEKLGVAGLSGSGKSTLIKILLGLYELESGKFHIGNKNYYAIRHEEITKNIAVALQETELFNFSLRNNITVMRDINAELLATAIETANLGEIIAKLPDGLDTIIGERGYSLSGGERQRLGIARTICKDAPILIFDEATSSLDSKTEAVIMDRLLKNLKQKTMLIIAHRLSTLRETDRIVVFENGKVAEEGKFDKLKNQKDSRFGQLYKLQHG